MTAKNRTDSEAHDAGIEIMSQEKSLFDSPEWRGMQKDMQDFQDEFEKDSEKAWNNLDEDTKLKVFCAISKKIHKAELIDNGTYRYVLYDAFGFGPEAYVPAQLSGYLDIHNAIYDDKRLLGMADKVKKFAEENNIDSEKTKELIKKIFRI